MTECRCSYALSGVMYLFKVEAKSRVFFRDGRIDVIFLIDASTLVTLEDDVLCITSRISQLALTKAGIQFAYRFHLYNITPYHTT